MTIEEMILEHGRLVAEADALKSRANAIADMIAQSKTDLRVGDLVQDSAARRRGMVFRIKKISAKRGFDPRIVVGKVCKNGETSKVSLELWRTVRVDSPGTEK